MLRISLKALCSPGLASTFVDVSQTQTTEIQGYGAKDAKNSAFNEWCITCCLVHDHFTMFTPQKLTNHHLCFSHHETRYSSFVILLTGASNEGQILQNCQKGHYTVIVSPGPFRHPESGANRIKYYYYYLFEILNFE